MDSFDGFDSVGYISDTYIEVLRYGIGNIHKVGDGLNISGYVGKKKDEYSNDTIPVSCMVSIFDGFSKELVSTTYSGDDGVYVFGHMKINHKYYITSYIDKDVTTNYYET